MSTSSSTDLLKGGSFILITLGLGLALSFLVKLVLARFLGRVEYGSIILGISILTAGNTVVVVGLDRGVGRYLPRYDDVASKRGVIVSALQIAMPFSFVVGLVIALLAGAIATHIFHDPSITPVLRVFGATIPLSVFVSLFLGTVQGLKKSLPKAIANLLLPLSQLVLIVLIMFLGFGVIVASLAYAASYALMCVAGLYYLVRYTPLLERVKPKKQHRELLLFSLPLMVSYITVNMFSNIDMFMLGYFSSTGIVGVYSAMYSLSTLLQLGLVSFGYLYMPTISDLHARGELEEMWDKYNVVTVWIAATTAPVFLVFILVPDVVIRYTFGPEYVAGILALVVLASGYMANVFLGPNMRTLVSIGETRAIMYNNVFVATVNVALNLVLIPRYSFLGAAAATTASYLVMNVLYSYVLFKTTGIYPRPTPKTIKQALDMVPGSKRS